MKCALCGHEFNENEGRTACRSCPLAKGCRLIRCPNCGYETLADTGLIKALKAWRKSKDAAGRKS